MGSPWCNPLPLGESAASRVVVYFYSGRWIPITYSTLADAIALSRKALLDCKEILIFPPDLNPAEFSATSSEENTNSPDFDKVPHFLNLTKMCY